MNVLVEPVNIKRIKKYKYPKIRNNYKKYQYANWNWEDIFVEIDGLKENGMREYIKYVSIKYNVNYSTLKHKYDNWKNGKAVISTI